MSTEVIANLWTFVKNKFAYEVGARLYMVTGDDDAKFAFLQALAPCDFHFAHRFPIPSNYSVTLVDGGKSKTIPRLMQPDPSDYLACFHEAWDPLKGTIPEHKIGIRGTASTRAPLHTNNLLTVNTYVEVDADGNQVPNIPNPAFAGKPAKLLLNRWAFADADSSQVFALTGRPYLAVGDDGQLARLASILAPDDYLLAPRIPIPASLGPVSAAEVLSKQALFDEVLRGIQQSIPLARLDWIAEKTTKYTFQPDKAKLKTSIVKENQAAKTSVADAAETAGEAPPPSSATPAAEGKNWWEFWK